MFKSVIFDMDGLMFDTENLAIEAWSHVCGEMGHQNVYDVVVKTLGLSVQKAKLVFLEHFGNNFDFDTAREQRMEYVVRHIEKYGIPLKPGLHQLLDHLKDRGYLVAVATSTEKERVKYYFRKADILNYFNEFVCGDMVENGKPAPDIYIKASELLCTEPNYCMVLEDSPAGIVSAFDAGMKAVMIPDLVQPTEEIEKMLYATATNLSGVVELLNRS